MSGVNLNTWRQRNTGQVSERLVVCIFLTGHVCVHMYHRQQRHLWSPSLWPSEPLQSHRCWPWHEPHWSTACWYPRSVEKKPSLKFTKSSVYKTWINPNHLHESHHEWSCLNHHRSKSNITQCDLQQTNTSVSQVWPISYVSIIGVPRLIQFSIKPKPC